jgi:hypothetical protein
MKKMSNCIMYIWLLAVISSVNYIDTAEALSIGQKQEYYPLQQGASWTYIITEESQDMSDYKITKESHTVEESVVKRINNGDFEIALMQNCRLPNENDMSKKCGNSIIVWKNGKFYSIDLLEDLNKLTHDKAYLSSKINLNNLFLVTPLKDKMEFGRNPDDPDRNDNMYEWFVEEEGKRRIDNIDGISPKELYTIYTISYNTLPDSQVIEYAPYIGIISSSYVHHGTVMNSDTKLIKFHAGGNDKN